MGETLVDETRAWGVWADWFGIPRLTFFAGLGGVIARGGDFRDVFELFRPGRRPARGGRATGRRRTLRSPVPRRSLSRCPARAPRSPGRRLPAGARRQPAGTRRGDPVRDRGRLRVRGRVGHLGRPQARPGLLRPDRRRRSTCRRNEIAYVGDRVDNDIRPAAAAGMRAIFLRRGPWAWIQQGRGAPAEAAATIESLAELGSVLEQLE